MSKKQTTQINIDELGDIVRHLVSNNRSLQKRGLSPVSLEVEGDSGIGKTSVLKQLAHELDLNFVKLNLAQIEELGDLVGFPIRQFELCRKADEDSKTCVWVDEHAVEEYQRLGYSFTGNNRMSYCPPEWIANKSSGGLLLLDDWTRADNRFMQAVMELIDRQEYISWKLPTDWHIILSANPDNGDYNVTTIDPAQKTRFLSVGLKFDLDIWARWAEGAGIDGRCINFLLIHPELVTKEVNARSITMFFNAISSFESFEANLPLIQIFGEGSVGQEFASLFTMFINNRLDKLISPKEMLFAEDEKSVMRKLRDSVGEGSSYRSDIASALSTRLANYSVHYAQDNAVGRPMISRIQNLVTNDIFTIDIRYNIVKTIFHGNKIKFRELTMKPEVAKYILG